MTPQCGKGTEETCFNDEEIYKTEETDEHISKRKRVDGNVTNGIVTPETHIGDNPSTIEVGSDLVLTIGTTFEQ